MTRVGSQRHIKKKVYSIFHNVTYFILNFTFSLLSIVITSREQHITNSNIHGRNTSRAPIFVKQYQICLCITEILIIWNSKVFNSLPTYVKDMFCNVKEFKLLLKNCLYSNFFYALEKDFHYNNT